MQQKMSFPQKIPQENLFSLLEKKDILEDIALQVDKI